MRWPRAFVLVGITVAFGVAPHRIAFADDDDTGDIEMDTSTDPTDSSTAEPLTPAPPPAPISPPPAHAAAFVAAYEALRGCVVGAPQWFADADQAHLVQQLLLGHDCDAERTRAREIAHAGEDDDRHVRTLWLDVVNELHRDLVGTGELRRVDRLAARFGFVAPTTFAPIPTLDPATAALLPGTEHAMDIHHDIPIDHRIAFRFEHDGVHATVASTGTSLRPTWTPPATFQNVVAVTGTGRERAFVQRGMELLLVRSHDGGKTWDRPRSLDGDPKHTGELKNLTIRSLANELDLIWRRDKTHVAWQIIDGAPGPLVPFTAAADARFDELCATRSTRWWFDTHRVGWLDARGSHDFDAHATPAMRLAACTPERVVLIASDAVAVCDRTHCTTGPRASRPLVDIDDRGAPVVVSRIGDDDVVVIGQRVVHAGGEPFAVTAGPEGPRLYVAREDGIVAFPIGAAP